jgi:chemotaxis protein MotA
MDFATILGMLIGFGLIITAMVLGGSPTAFINIPSILIVVGGTFAVTMISFSFREMARANRAVLGILFQRTGDAADAGSQLLELAEHARKEGVLVLQKVLGQFEGEPFLHRAIQMVSDGTTGDEVERIMRKELSSMRSRHGQSVGVLRRAAEVSPAMGLIGTLVGLVQMLGGLDDPSTIGPAMAVALLTTFYGAVMATMVFSPLATKLERNSSAEILLNEVYVTAAASIGRHENPRRLEMLLNALLPPTERIAHFD